jgi:hypothetical protein
MYKIIREIKKSIKFHRLSDLFRSDQENTIATFHSNYLISFVIEFILFGGLSIYLYKSSKYYNKNIEDNMISVPRGLKEKYDISIFLLKAVIFRCLTLIFFLFFENKTSYDLISYTNFLLHIFPSFMFLMCLYINIGFLIEKFYEISLRRIYISKSLKYILYFSLLLIILLSISVFIFKIYKESYFFIESLMCLIFLIIGFLYLIYGKKISNFMKESNNIRLNNPIAMKTVRSLINEKIIGICFLICPAYIIFGTIKGLVAINFFGVWYPTFIDLNLYDCIAFFFCELLPSFIIGRKNKKWNNFKIEELCNQPNMIINDSGERPLLEERVEIVGNNGTVEEKMEEFFENFEGYKKI